MSDLNNSPNTWAAITPSDTVDIPGQKNNKAPSRIYAAGAGNITMLDASGTSALFVFAAAQTRELSPTRIMATSTTATGIIGLW